MKVWAGWKDGLDGLDERMGWMVGWIGWRYGLPES